MVHYFLAMKYRMIARKIPAQFNGEPENPETKYDRTKYNVLLFFSVIGGPCKALANAFVRISKQIPGHKAESDFMDKVGNPILFNIVGVCQIVYGVILIRSVVRIRRFFKQRKDENYIYTAALCRHATCFVVYLVCCVTYYV